MSRAEARGKRWKELQWEIAKCQLCCGHWPRLVCHPIGADEIPEPPPVVEILFVGVAPTSESGRSRGAHFYSGHRDQLRQGLFRLLAEGEFGVEAAGQPLLEAIEAFHRAHLFFVHGAKVRLAEILAPPSSVIAFCAAQHLGKEIKVLNPRVVCFLGKRTAPAARSVFGREIGEKPEVVSIDSWRGVALVTTQPVRGTRNELRTRVALRTVWRA